MIKNYNGGVIKELAKKSLAANRRRNTFCIITIALSVCIIATCSLAFAASRQMEKNKFAESYQAAFTGISDSILQKLKGDKALSCVGEYCFIGRADLGGCTVDRFYIDDNAAKMTGLQYDGALPKGRNDILIEKSLLSKLNKSASVGGNIRLDLGDGEKAYHITGILNKADKAEDSHAVFVSKSLLNAAPREGVVRVAYIRVAGSDNMPAQRLKDAVYDIARRHGVDRKTSAKIMIILLRTSP